ncbi:MAG: PilZ domain-containing protein [Deltaproteobacteria bacterium]|nr:PilZ domain-containing protein [Deltaproteobacteria bacterium]
MEETRGLQRYSLQLPATIEIVAEAEDRDKELINLLTSNVCSGGAYFHTEKPLPEGTNVKIDLVLSIDELKKIKGKHALIKVTGQVVRTESEGMAISFKNDYKIRPVG